MLRSESVFLTSSISPSCHAATIVEAAPGQFLAAWFGGSHEGHSDVAIWLARFAGAGWSTPIRVADMPDVPLWNPVLYRDVTGKVWLFYKIGPTIPSWTGCYLLSSDGGQTWSAPTLLPAGLLGPAKNKPITLSNGHVLCPTSAETWRNWVAWVEISADGGHTWSKHGPITAPGFGMDGGDNRVSATWDATSQRLLLPQDHAGTIQPTVWEYAPGHLRMLLRATQRIGAVLLSDSHDYGHTWSTPRPTVVPNPNSGIDAVRLTDSRIVLACNPTRQGRSPLSLLVSADNGETWPRQLDLETAAGECSYPSIIQAADGRVHVVYTWLRTHIQHVIADPDELA